MFSASPVKEIRYPCVENPNSFEAAVISSMLHQLLEHIAQLPRWQKRSAVFAIDVMLLVASTWIAYSLRLGEWSLWNEAVAKVMAGALPLMVVSFWRGEVYRTVFRFAGRGTLRGIIKAFAPYTIGMVAIYMIWSIDGVPRTIGLLQPITFFLLMAASRSMFHLLMVDLLSRHRFNGETRNVLIYGAGIAGQQLASSMRSDPEMRLRGYIDDDQRLDGQRLDGDPVYWSGRLNEAIAATQATDILLAIPGASRSRRREIVDNLQKFQVQVNILPQMKEMVGGKVSISDIRPLEIEDLLGREPVEPDGLLLSRTIENKTVLVTGAGGSIGSELCRQILNIGANRILLFDVSEYALYLINQELRHLSRNSGVEQPEIIAMLGSVTDTRRMDEVFSKFAVHTIYHAAAYKHVPLVESNPVEGIRNNIVGTYNVLRSSQSSGVQDFILVSTDKAVRPTSVMGASKRGAEQVLQSFHEEQRGMCCSMVRFGNVLGSSGSVVPLFRRQIEDGGPITLTDKDVTRYFMTIPEAANLVIQAGGLARGGEVFVLDMGKPLRIADLARTMIQLSGLTVKDERHPHGDIEILEVGLRPGEKLFEELLIGRNPRPTAHPRIMKAHEDFLPWSEVREVVDELATCGSRIEALRLLRTLVPEFDHMRDNRRFPAAAE